MQRFKYECSKNNSYSCIQKLTYSDMNAIMYTNAMYCLQSSEFYIAMD